MTRFSILALLAGMSGTLLQAADRPNLIVVFTDDQGYADLSSQKVLPDVRTPNIDVLVAGGVRMTDGYVTAPQCVPSRGGLLTGQYQNRFGLESNMQFQQEGGLNGFNDAVTIAERLKQAGYVTGMAGKWHLGPADRITEHGFDKVFCKYSGRPGIVNFDLTRKDIPLGKEDSGMYHLDACSAVACAFIERFKDKPFFFYLAYRAPHVPLDPPRKYLDRFPGDMSERRRRALAMLSAVDDGTGMIMDTLRRNHLEENTLIFLISDNGAPLKIHKWDTPGIGNGWNGSLNNPLNGEKGMLTEGGIRTPFVAYWKDTLPAGTVYRQPVISLDVAATANAVAGLEHDPVLDGVNLIPYLTGKIDHAPHGSLYWRWNGQAAIRKGKWKYLTVGSREWLFDLSSDIGETNNVLAEHRQTAHDLRKEWDEWSKSLKPPGLQGDASDTANRYFDWFLDGKRQPEPEVSGRTEASSKAFEPRIGNVDLFLRRDANGDGEVSLVEFINGRTGNVVKTLTRRFRTLDRNQNGVWDRAEVRAK